MSIKNPQKQERILEGGGEFFWLARIYTPVICKDQKDITMQEYAACVTGRMDGRIKNVSTYMSDEGKRLGIRKLQNI